MPVGSVGPWFDRALDALRSQSHRRLEIILVLDGLGSDASDAVHSVAAEDPRIVVVENAERRGAGNARNVGLRVATGDHVAFADADDLVPPDAYERLLAVFAESDPDVVSGRAEQFTADGREVTYWTTDDALWATGGSALRISDTPQLAFDHTPWNKVFTRTWLRGSGVEFPTGTTCEDVSWWARLAVRATVDVLPEVVYRHRRHDESVTSGIGRGDDLDDWIAQTRAATGTYTAHGAREATAALGRRLIRREAWTRVRGIDALGPDGARLLVDFVRWIETWADVSEFDQLSAFPRTAYALLRQGEPELAADLVQTFDRPSEDAVALWRDLATGCDRAIGPDAERAAALWRERMFRPAVDAAQRGETLPVRPEVVAAFWDEFIGGGLDEHEQVVLSALRDGAVDDVAFLRRNRRVRPTADRRRGGLRISVAGLERAVHGRIVLERGGARTIVHEGAVSSDAVVISTSHRPGDRWSVDFPLSNGRSHRVAVTVAPSGLTRFVGAVRTMSGRRA
ncbi:glycosyltransferase [Curtobacterium sp. PhB115]|uniref:glycosyltransferase family 2 protein n=1 Tax=Curtobacterium sp. PhB115 TaxID=2485173 RepID=UPI001C863C5D|nr:glycosyltransferase [Curtobacterium sp. PhB115]